MLRVLCRFFEKKLRKKLSCRKVFGSFQKKYARRLLSIVGRFYLVGVCGLEFDGTMPEFKSFCFVFSKNEWGLGQRPIKTAFSFCKAFSFAPFVPKEKAMWG